MGFWDSLGNTLGDITGVNQADRGRQQSDTGQSNQNAAGQTLGGIAGVNPAQFAAGAGQEGQALGQQMGQTAAAGGTQAATQAARTAGVNKGQAAILGGQQAGRSFTEGQTAGQGLGMGAYGQGAANQLGAANAQGNLGTNQMQGSIAQTGQGNQATGGLLNMIGGLFSDENMKEGVKEGPDIEQILSKIDPIRFKYKKEAGEGSAEQIGVTAQDIEKTPMKGNVIDTPKGKMVDTRKQEMSNLNLIVQLASRIKELESEKGK